MRVHHEIGIEQDHLVARIDRGQESEKEAAARAAGDEHIPVGVAVLAVLFDLILAVVQRLVVSRGLTGRYARPGHLIPEAVEEVVQSDELAGLPAPV